MRLFLRCLAFVLLALSMRAQELDLMLAAQLFTLEDPITVETKRGQDFSGRVESYSEDTLILVTEAGGGEVIFTFKADDILRIRFPGNDLKEVALEYAEVGEFETALIIVDKLFTQRSELFPLVEAAEINYFVQSIPIYREAGQLREAYDRIEILRQYLDTPESIRMLEAEQLLLAHQLDLKPEVKSLAATWIEAEGREVRNALGSCLLALQLIEEGRPEEAFQTVLYPITFSRGRSITYLGNCYAIALELARFLEQENSVVALSAEMERRGFATTLEWNDFSPPDYSRLDLPRPNL